MNYGGQHPARILGGRFACGDEVGRGGVGVVYRALDRVTNLEVALKIIAITGVDASEEARFVREGRVLASLRHPGIVRVVAFGNLDEGQPYVAMEWLEGEDLAKRQKRAPLTLSEALEVAAQTADALAAAHAAGIVHRDVKPSNLFLIAEEGLPFRVKLVDFGVAAAQDSTITKTGAIVGTPAYMAPEQARGEDELDARADLYALGSTLFELCAGRPPHVGPTPIAVLARLVTTPAPRLAELVPRAPRALDNLLADLLAQRREDRPADADTVARLLRALAASISRGDPNIANRDDSSGELAPQSSGAPSSVGSQVLSQRLSSGGTRLVTTIVATGVPKGAPRQRIMAHLRTRGAEATELGGDAIVAHLGVLRALGDEAAQAIDLSVRLAKLGAMVGVATGRTRVDGTRPTGEVVDRAAALARDAERNQVLTDTTTTELARGRYEFIIWPNGTGAVGAELQGKREGGGGAPFVGREADLAQLVSAFERATDDRTPVVATVTGTSGIGKTRLRREAVARISAQASHPRILSASCEAFARSRALGLVTDLVRELIGVQRGASDAAIAEKLHRLAPTATPAEATRAAGAAARGHSAIASVALTEPTRIALAQLLASGHDDGAAAVPRDVAWVALTEVVTGYARTRPLVIACEDVQWADSESVAWLDHLIGRAAGLPLFVLLTMRPPFWRDAAVRFQGREHARIELRPLAVKSIRAIAKAMLGERADTAEGERLIESISAQAGGSPLFAEELARLTAQGRDASRAATIEAAIQVQLDALDDAEREALVRLSVYGLTGWEAGLVELGVADAEVRLRNLAAAELVVEHAGSRFPGTRQWAFKHALTREVAYASLSEDRAKERHRQAAAWLAKVGEDDLVIAKHMDLGGIAEQSAPHLENAAKRALAINALQQAVDLAERALAFADDKPSAFARAQILDEAWSRLDARAGERAAAVGALEANVTDAASSARALGARARFEDAGGGTEHTTGKLEEVYAQARALEAHDEQARTGAALAARLAFAGELDRAEIVCGELLAMAEAQNIPGAAVDGWQTLAVVRQTRGDIGAALDARGEAVQAAHAAQLLTREATLRLNVGFALTTIGAREQAREALLGGYRLGQTLGAPGVLRHGQMTLLCWCATFGTPTDFQPELADARQLADDAVLGSWVPHDRGTLGLLFYRGAELLAEGKRLEDARQLLKLAADAYAATQMLDVVPVALGLLADAERRLGRAEEAASNAERAESLLSHGSPSLLNEAPVYLALHDAYMDQGRLEAARAAVASGMPRLEKRYRALTHPAHARAFLRDLRANAALLAAAEAYGLLPAAIALQVSHLHTREAAEPPQ